MTSGFLTQDLSSYMHEESMDVHNGTQLEKTDRGGSNRTSIHPAFQTASARNERDGRS